MHIGELRALTADDWQDFGPSWPPNGSLAAFFSFKVGGDKSIRVVDPREGTVRTLVPPEENPAMFEFAWSPDGQELFYIIYDGHSKMVEKSGSSNGRNILILYGWEFMNLFFAMLIITVSRLGDRRCGRPQNPIPIPLQNPWATKLVAIDLDRHASSPSSNAPDGTMTQKARGVCRR